MAEDAAAVPATAATAGVARRRAAFAAHRAGRLDEAAAVYRAHLARSPGDADAWTSYGILLRRTGCIAGAVACQRRAAALRPADPRIGQNLGNALHEAGDWEEALAIREALHHAAPEDGPRQRDLAATLRALGRDAEAIALVDRLAAAGRAHPLALTQRGLARLMLGLLGPGFADLEHRFAGGEVRRPQGLPGRPWGDEPVAGRRLLLTPEQGMGDTIALARFLPGLRALGPAEIVLATRPGLRRLLEGVAGADRVVDRMPADPPPLHLPLPSLPHRLGTSGPPPPPARLALPADSVARARAIVAPHAGSFRIGVVWTGSATNPINARRSVCPTVFLRLAALPGVQLFSLYKGPAHAAFLASGAAGPIVDAAADDRDLADGAALAAAMDLLICTDTGIVHAAASLDREVWLLNARESFWYWGHGERSPWYPGVRIFRQERQGDWDGVLGRVVDALRERLAARGGGR